MKLVTNHRISRKLRYAAMAHKVEILPYAPLVIFIDPCNLCDLCCSFCPQSQWGKRERGFMSYQLFTEALNQAIELKPQRINLFCFGEPFLNKDIFRMIRYATERNQWIRMHCNAKSLDEDKARQLLKSGLSELRFSFDTPNKELYNKMRIGGDYDSTLENIIRFLTLQKEGGYRYPLVHLQEIVPFVPDQKPKNSRAYCGLFKGFDVNFQARYMHNFADVQIKSEFSQLKKQAGGKSPCQQIYSRIVIAFDGKIHACCLDSEGHNIIGDLTKGDTIASAWNGPEMQRIRRLTNQRALKGLKPCDTCDQLNMSIKVPRSRIKRLLMKALWYIYS